MTYKSNYVDIELEDHEICRFGDNLIIYVLINAEVYLGDSHPCPETGYREDPEVDIISVEVTDILDEDGEFTHQAWGFVEGRDCFSILTDEELGTIERLCMQEGERFANE